MTIKLNVHKDTYEGQLMIYSKILPTNKMGIFKSPQL